MLDRIFFELFESHNSLGVGAMGDDFLRVSCGLLGVDHLAYLGVNLPAKNNRNYYVHNTYSETWAHHYETENYISVDPIVRLGMTSLMPIEWQGMEKLGPQQKRLFGESKEFGVGSKGITFPVRGLRGETAIFSVTATKNESEWQFFKRSQLKEMRIIAEFFHQRVVGSLQETDGFKEVILTAREIECLKWSAEGKTYEDIGTILGIRSRTVRFFLENARHKLDCLNTTHAVVCARARGLI